MAKVMFSLPDKLVIRMKATISVGERSKLVAEILSKEVEAREEGLYKLAVKLEANRGLRQEMAVWDAEFSKDGLDDA